MKQHWRVIAEVAVLAVVASVLPLLLSIPLLALLDTLGAIVAWLLPFTAAFYYGYRRNLPLHLAAVWTGWLIGQNAFGAVFWVTFLRHAHLRHHKPLTPYLWLNLSKTIAWNLLFALLPALVTMWGQRVRLRASHSR